MDTNPASRRVLVEGIIFSINTFTLSFHTFILIFGEKQKIIKNKHHSTIQKKETNHQSSSSSFPASSSSLSERSLFALAARTEAKFSPRLA